MSQTFHGSCHCEAVKFSFEADAIEKGLRCNCSICKRKGAMMSPDVIAREQLTIEADESDLGVYRFGSQTASHYFCRQCGIYTFHETARFPDHFRVNLGCVDELDTFALESDVFDGKNLL